MNKRKVLVIEDDKVIINAIKILLELNNVEAFRSAHGEEVPEVLNREHFDLIICSLSSAGPSVAEVTSLIKNNRRYYKTPLIILAEPTDETDRRNAMNLGADDYIRKPVSGKVLLATIKARLELSEKYEAFNKEEVNQKIFSVLNKNFSQEFISPLNSIVNATFMLASTPDLEKDGYDELLNAIYASSFRMRRTTQNLVAYSSLEIPESWKRDKDVLLKDVLLEIVGYYENGMTPDQKIINMQAENVGYWDGPEKNMRIIFTELIDNAVKFSSPTSTPEVRLFKRDNIFTFSVTNQLAKPMHFEIGNIAPFTKFHQDLSRNGLGIGLFISKSLCEKMGYQFFMNKQGDTISFTVQFS
jgi:two-component system, sensor histidine kinase and response regulator